MLDHHKGRDIPRPRDDREHCPNFLLPRRRMGQAISEVAKRSCGDLIQQLLEQVMIALIDDRDVNPPAG
jgi:hypothetical protein